VGGDTSVGSDKIFIDVALAGAVRRGDAIYRGGARPGDQLFVSGRLGLSALGLHRLKGRAGAGPRGMALDSALQAHLYPEPRLALGRILGQAHLASALIDLSDGLSTDLAHLCDSSEVGADVWAERLPRPKDLTREERLALDPLDLALHGGEDYELLFTVSKRNLARLERRRFGVPVHRIGEISRAKRMKLILPRGQATGLKPFGYDQFVRTFKKAY
jgi:thiamine-monophosphate kinase